MPAQASARGISIPAPVGGLDALSPLAAMPASNAIALDNCFPQPGYVEIRKGHGKHNLVTGAPAIESLMPYNALAVANDKLFAAGSTKIWDVTTLTTATISAAAVTSLSNARFQHTNMSTSGGQFLWICNGADAPRYYDGSTWATASVTGITPTDIINCAVFKNRLWLARKDTLNAAYLNTDSIAGTATPFDLTGVFTKGGYLQAIGSWSRDGGDGPNDSLAFLSSRGEVAVYTGVNPATDFILKSVYTIGPPIGRRCLLKVGADLAVISVDGVLPLSQAVQTDRAAALNAAITKNIHPLMNAAARSYKDNFGWQLVGYPRGTRAILNIPLTENVSQEQYVMNTITGAWGHFTGENANCWAVFQDRLFYGGNAGRIVEADSRGFDDDGAIDFNVETAFSYAGAKGKLKQFTMCRALLTTDGQAAPGLAINIDFARTAEVDAVGFATVLAAQWGVDKWDEGVWPEITRIVTDWLSVSGEGYTVSIRMAGSIVAPSGAGSGTSLTLQLNGWDLLCIDGAPL